MKDNFKDLIDFLSEIYIYKNRENMVFEIIKKVLLETFQFFSYLLVGVFEVIVAYMAVLTYSEKPILCSGSV